MTEAPEDSEGEAEPDGRFSEMVSRLGDDDADSEAEDADPRSTESKPDTPARDEFADGESSSDGVETDSDRTAEDDGWEWVSDDDGGPDAPSHVRERSEGTEGAEEADDTSEPSGTTPDTTGTDTTGTDTTDTDTTGTDTTDTDTTDTSTSSESSGREEAASAASDRSPAADRVWNRAGSERSEESDAPPDPADPADPADAPNVGSDTPSVGSSRDVDLGTSDERPADESQSDPPDEDGGGHELSSESGLSSRDGRVSADDHPSGDGRVSGDTGGALTDRLSTPDEAGDRWERLAADRPERSPADSAPAGGAGGDELDELAWLDENVLVVSPFYHPITDDACARLFHPGATTKPNLLFVTVDEPSNDRLELCNRESVGDIGEIAVIELGSYSGDQATASRTTSGDREVSVKRVSKPSNLPKLGIMISKQLDEWDNRGPTVLSFHSITAMLQYVSDERLFRFLHVLNGRLSSANGVGHYLMDSEAHSERQINSFRSMFDSVVRIAEDGTVDIE